MNKQRRTLNQIEPDIEKYDLSPNIRNIYNSLMNVGRQKNVAMAQKIFFDAIVKHGAQMGYSAINPSQKRYAKRGRIFMIQNHAKIKQSMSVSKIVRDILEQFLPGKYKLQNNDQYARKMCTQLKNNRQVSIGKVLNKLQVALKNNNKTRQAALVQRVIRRFDADPVFGHKAVKSKAATTLNVIMISKNNHDLALMSTSHGWQPHSCMALGKSQQQSYLKNDISKGTIVIFYYQWDVSEGFQTNMKPVSRILLYPYHNTNPDKADDIVFLPAKDSYDATKQNNVYTPFRNFVVSLVDDIQKDFRIKGIYKYKMPKGLYLDMATHTQFGEQTGVDQEKARQFLSTITAADLPLNDIEKLKMYMAIFFSVKPQQIDEYVTKQGGQYYVETQKVLNKKIPTVKGWNSIVIPQSVCKGGRLPVLFKPLTSRYGNTSFKASECGLKTIEGMPGGFNRYILSNNPEIGNFNFNFGDQILSLQLDNTGLSSLDGLIGRFSNNSSLNISFNAIRRLQLTGDLVAARNMKSIRARNNNIMAVDISDISNIQLLDLDLNAMSTLDDLSGNTTINKLSIKQNTGLKQKQLDIDFADGNIPSNIKYIQYKKPERRN